VEKTRPSLLLRIQRFDDHESWEQFVDLYGPLILRYVRRIGIRHEEALDLVQEVLTIVMRRIPHFEYDSSRGSFRGWLKKVTTHRAWRYLDQRRRQGIAAGGTVNLAAIQQRPGTQQKPDAWMEEEWRKRLMEIALRRVRAKTSTRVWRAFELNVLEARPAEDVAQELEMSVGHVYVSKCRVLKQLRKTMEQIDE